MKRAVIYARISQDRTGAHLGVSRQWGECEDLARREELQVVDKLMDNDISAYSGKPRPGYDELLRRISGGEVDVVLVWHTDRLHRVPGELEDYIAACNVHGVQTLTVKAGFLDLATPAGRYIARQMGSYARYESDQKGERISAKRRQAALAGEWQGGPRPFGWNITKETDERGGTRHRITVNDEEAELVRLAFQAVLEGKSISSIVARFQHSGVRSVRGTIWRHSTVRALLDRTRNCGIESLKGEEVGASTFPALVDEGTFRAAQRILRQPGRRTQDDNRIKHLLSGIARCHCGAVMLASKNAEGSRTYTCESYRYPAAQRKDVKHVVRRMEDLDAYVEDLMPGVISLPWGGFRLHTPAAVEDIREIETELVKLRAKQDDLMDMWRDDDLTKRQFIAMNTELTAKIQTAEQKVASVAQEGQELPDLQPNQAREYWNSLDVLGKRAVMKQCVEITCYPTGGKHFRAFVDKSPYVRVQGRTVKDGDQRIVYWAPTVEAEYDEWDEELNPDG